MGAVINCIIGINFDGLRRAGFSAGERAEIKTAFKLLYKRGLNTAQAVERARQMEWNTGGRAFFDFVASAKKRGICDVRTKARPPDKIISATADFHFPCGFSPIFHYALSLAVRIQPRHGRFQ